MKAPYATALLAVLSIGVASSSLAEEKRRPLVARDCVTVRNLQVDESSWRSSIQISPDGRRVAYPVRAPNLATNQNDIELYVRKLPLDSGNSGGPTFVGEVSQVRWRPDSRHLTFLRKESGKRVIEELDSFTGDHSVLFKTDADIPEYSIDDREGTLILATDTPAAAKTEQTPEEIARGYQIPFQKSPDSPWPKRRLFVVRRSAGGWGPAQAVVVRSPLSRQPLTDLAHAGNADLQPTLSPDGKKLLLSYWDFSSDMPAEWRDSGWMQVRNRAGIIQAFVLLVLYDIDSGETSVPLKTSWVISAPLWSPDSQAFLVVGRPVINSDLERETLKTHVLEHSASALLFWVEPSSGKVETVAPKVAYPWAGPLRWDKNGDVLVQVSAMDTVVRYSHGASQWREISSFQIPVRVGDQVATDGNLVIGEFNDTTMPPQLFVYRVGEKAVDIFAKLNPQFDQLTLGEVREVRWTTSTGFNASGLMLLPPGYDAGKRYPLVIHTKPFGSFFVCSFGNYPSFAPQPIANAGILYLGPGRLIPKESTQKEEDFFPKGYPGYQGAGGVAEAAFAMDMWDSAVKSLDQQGVIDPQRVGIIGFSRTGWYTEFILTHSQVPYRAATVADNVQYSLGEYWLSHDPGTIKTYDLTYGGQPYGSTLKNWLDHSISFNLDKIRTPLLMEEMGEGRPYDNPVAPPLNLAAAFEVFTGLNRLHKPVELYYYPSENHTPQHPQARLATMQRNVDWYRFWLKDEEDSDPAKAGQYGRWRELRKLQQAQ